MRSTPANENAAVALKVTTGLCSVLSGRVMQAKMITVPTRVFNHPDVLIHMWFDDGAAASSQLSTGSSLFLVHG
jgi:hypothetical protein